MQLPECLGFEEDATKKKKKKNFIDPFNSARNWANQTSVLRLTPHEKRLGIVKVTG